MAIPSGPSTLAPPLVYITRRESFSAAHRLHSSQLTDEENRDLFGKCNHVHGHGHNYRLEATVRGPVSPIADHLKIILK